jgi:lipoate-protein ligase B
MLAEARPEVSAPLRVESIPGLIAYERARELQLERLEARARGEIPDTVLFLEHEPVITRGRGLQWSGAPRERSLPLGPLPAGVAYSESERGGDLTYHGPGQLVVYPIFKVSDVAGHIRRLERTLIVELASLGLDAGARVQATGVWVRQAGADRKVASIGIAVRRWVTYHGMAINVVNDLAPFRLISPCGFAPEVMTRLSDLVELPADWRPWLEGRLAERLASR